jgi:hypothetical protein
VYLRVRCIQVERVNLRVIGLVSLVAVLRQVSLAQSSPAAADNGRPKGNQAVVRSPFKVDVHLADGANAKPQIKALAMVTAAKILATADVQLDWHRGVPPRGARHPIAIELRNDERETWLPDALAYSLPYEGVHITVFYDRVLRRTPNPAVLLAHVMAHEIVHMLEGSSGHSESGLMKAVWTHDDYREMQLHPLPFTPYDLIRIQLGLAGREHAPGIDAKGEK